MGMAKFMVRVEVTGLGTPDWYDRQIKVLDIIETLELQPSDIGFESSDTVFFLSYEGLDTSECTKIQAVYKIRNCIKTIEAKLLELYKGEGEEGEVQYNFETIDERG